MIQTIKIDENLINKIIKVKYFNERELEDLINELETTKIKELMKHFIIKAMPIEKLKEDFIEKITNVGQIEDSVKEFVKNIETHHEKLVLNFIEKQMGKLKLRKLREMELPLKT